MKSNQITQIAQTAQTVHNVHNVLYPVKIALKKPYNKGEIDTIRNKINERVEYLKTYEPIIYKRRQADLELTQLYHQLNSYNLNPPQPRYFTRLQKRVQFKIQSPK
jgi:hypothetical protein